MDSARWDPIGVVLIISVLQTIFYSLYCLLVLSIGLVARTAPSLDQILDANVWSKLDPSVTISAASLLLLVVPDSIALTQVVERPSKIWDFALTRFAIHLVICIASYGFPWTWIWWLFNILNLAGEIVLGEFLCLRREAALFSALREVTTG